MSEASPVLIPCGPLKPPHRRLPTCQFSCNNHPPGTHTTWDQYEQTIRYEVLMNRFLATRT